MSSMLRKRQKLIASLCTVLNVQSIWNFLEEKKHNRWTVIIAVKRYSSVVTTLALNLNNREILVFQISASLCWKSSARLNKTSRTTIKLQKKTAARIQFVVPATLTTSVRKNMNKKIHFTKNGFSMHILKKMKIRNQTKLLWSVCGRTIMKDQSVLHNLS